MPRKTQVLFPAGERQVSALGERLRLARQRRRFSMTDAANRAGITRATLYKVETGDPGVSLGVYYGVLRVLGLHGDLDGLARDDALGRKLQDLRMQGRGKKGSTEGTLES